MNLCDRCGVPAVRCGRVSRCSRCGALVADRAAAAPAVAWSHNVRNVPRVIPLDARTRDGARRAGESRRLVLL